jgi:hypothetical protein
MSEDRAGPRRRVGSPLLLLEPKVCFDRVSRWSDELRVLILITHHSVLITFVAICLIG